VAQSAMQSQAFFPPPHHSWVEKIPPKKGAFSARIAL